MASRLESSPAPPLTVDNVMKVVEGVNWRTLCHGLFGKYTLKDGRVVPTTDSIQSKHQCDEACLKAVVETFLDDDRCSWRKLIWALYKSNHIAHAEHIRSYAEPLKDASLTIDNLIKVMELVSADRFMKVWKELGVPESVVTMISGHLSTTKEKTRTCVDHYLNCHPNVASWERITRVLYDWREMTAARVSKVHLNESPDPTFTVENVVREIQKVTMHNRRRLWKKVFGYDRDVVAQIYDSHSSDEEKLCSISDIYVNCKPGSSWEQLVCCLYENGEMAATEIAKAFLPPKDLTITTDRLMELFQSVEDPDRTGPSYFTIGGQELGPGIGEWLGLPQSSLDEIQMNYHSPTRRKEAYLDAYANQHPWPSWRKVVDVLLDCDCYRESKDVESTYVQVSDKTLLNFDLAMKDGTLMIRNGDVVFLGPGGSGKTHTLAAILDEDPPSIRESTPCAKQTVRTIAECKVGVKGVKFARLKDEEYSDMLGFSANQIQPSRPSVSTTTQAATQTPPQYTAPERPNPPSASASSVASPDKSSATGEESSSGAQIKKRPCGFQRELMSRMQALPKASDDLNLRDLLNMRDSGGQPSFHEVLPVFVKNTTFGIITVKLNERLDARPKVEYYTNGQPVGKPFDSPFTHMQTYQHCMRVLQSTCDRDTCPKVVFIGTHKDLEHECKGEDQQEKNRKLKEIIPPQLKDSIVYADGAKGELLFAINAKRPGKEDREVIATIRQMMLKELENLPREKIPLQYFALENEFLRRAKYQKKGVLSKAECLEIAASYHFTEEKFEAALKYLHGLKLIFYYEDCLPGVVFISAQTLLNKITELVEYILSLLSDEIHEPVIGSLEEFKAYGIITPQLLSKFQSHYVPGLFQEKELIKLFEYLRIFAKVASGKYLVPCLLKVKHIPRPLAHCACEAVSALLFYFGPNGPKLGVYCFLVSTLITEAKWELMTENDCPVQLSRNQVQFALPGDDPGAITITDVFSTHLHVTIDLPSKMKPSQIQQICSVYCPRIRETILSSIRKASQKLNYTNSVPKISFPCSEHMPEQLHPAVISTTGLLTCTAQRKSVFSTLEEHHKIWLGKDLTSETGAVLQDSSVSSSPSSGGATSSANSLDCSPSLAKLKLLRSHGGKINIIKRLSPNWKGLGDLLDFDVDGTQLRIIEKRYSNDPEECCRAMFQYWLAGNGVKCSWSTLIELLKDCDEEVLAKDIEAAFNK